MKLNIKYKTRRNIPIVKIKGSLECKPVEIYYMKHSDVIKDLHIEPDGDWIDVYAAEDINIKGPKAGLLSGSGDRSIYFNNHKIDLGISIQLPKGYEAILASRSSNYDRYHIVMANSIGIIDNSFCGEDDIWQMNVIAFEDIVIPKGTKIAQFRIQLNQFATTEQKLNWLVSSGISINKVEFLNNKNRGGFGSTGK